MRAYQENEGGDGIGFTGGKGLRSQIHYVDVSSKTDVVGQVPAGVVGIFVEHYVVGVPQPAVAPLEVPRRDREIVSAEPEAVGAAAAQMPDVLGAESGGEMAVLPRVVDVVVGIVWAGIVAYPCTVGVDVGSAGMAGLIAEGVAGRRQGWSVTGRWGVGRCGTVRGRRRRVASPAWVASAFWLLGQCCKREKQERGDQHEALLHTHLHFATIFARGDEEGFRRQNLGWTMAGMFNFE